MNEQSLGPRPDPDSDQQTGRLLEDWLRDEAPTHAPPVTMPNARARIALTRRRPMLLIRDWWRWRPGRSNRGFRRMNAVTQLAAVAVLALSGLGLFMVATGGPAADSPAPGVVPDPAEVVAKVTGSLSGSTDPTVEETSTMGEFAMEHRGLTGIGRSVSNDERLEGETEVTFLWDDFTPDDLDGAALKTMLIRIWNDEGSWEGVAHGIRYPDEVYGDSHTAGLLSGSGGYEGLSAYLLWDADNHFHTFEGLIFPGDMPE